MSIKQTFDAISKEYDAQRRQIIPWFDDFYTMPLSALNLKTEKPRILDIGSGTGLYAAILLEKYPDAELTLIDLSDQMLEQAKKRFAGRDVKIIQADYTDYPLDGEYDLIISALSIHHLTPEQKQALFKTCYRLLADGGVFLNADQVKSPSEKIEAMHINLWKQAILRNGLTEADVAAAAERMRHDKPSTLEEHLRWLGEAGFRHADAVYKYYHFCVMYAEK